MLNDHGNFCTQRFMIPSAKPRGFWHGDNVADKIRWSWAPRSSCGKFWETSKMRGSFATEEEAIAAAKANLD